MKLVRKVLRLPCLWRAGFPVRPSLPVHSFRYLIFAILLTVSASVLTNAKEPSTKTTRILPPAANIPTAQDQAKAQQLYKLSRAARQAEAEDNWAQALEIWQAIYQERPGDFSAYSGIRHCLIALVRYDDALAFIDSAMNLAASGKLSMDPSEVAADKIEALFMAGRDSAAVKEINRQISNQRGFPNIYRSIANILYAQRRSDDAIALLKRGRKDTNNPFLFSREIAQFAEARMDWSSAVVEYLLYLEESPNNLGYIIGAIGDIMFEPGGDTLVSNAIALKIKSIDKNKLDPFLELHAGLLFRQNRYAESLNVYRQLDELRNAQGKVLLEAAQKLSDENESLLALEAFNEFLKIETLGESRYRTMIKVAKAWESLGNIDSSVTVCRSILTPGAPLDAVIEANVLLGKYSLGRKESPSVAREYFDNALSLARKAPNAALIDLEAVAIGLSMTYQIESRFDPAKKELEKFIKQSGARVNAASKARMELAKLSFRGGDFDDARAQTEALLTADPSSEVCNEALKLLALIDELKDYPDVLRLFGQVDMLTMLNKTSEALLLLDSLSSRGAAARIVEEAIWIKVFIYSELEDYNHALENLEFLISSEEGILSRDKALWEAGEISRLYINDPSRSRRCYEQLLREYPDSPLVEQTRKRVKTLLTQTF